VEGGGKHPCKNMREAHTTVTSGEDADFKNAESNSRPTARDRTRLTLRRCVATFFARKVDSENGCRT
jgi:hypothetical protein